MYPQHPKHARRGCECEREPALFKFSGMMPVFSFSGSQAGEILFELQRELDISTFRQGLYVTLYYSSTSNISISE